MEAVKQGDSIECLSALVISRDIKLSGLFNHPKIGQCRKFNCKRNSAASITKEIADKKKKKFDQALVDIGDKVAGENITVFVKGVKKIKMDVDHHSSSHKAQFMETNEYTYAEISLQFHNIRLLNDPKQLKSRSE